MGQGLVPDPADERAGEQGQGPGGQAEAVLGAFEQGRAEQVGQAGQGEDHPAQQAGGEGDLPGVGGGARLREGAGHPGVELLGESEGVVPAVGEPDVLVRHAVGFEDGGDLVGVDGGGDEHVEALGEFVHRVGGGVGGGDVGAGAVAARPGDGREGVGAGTGTGAGTGRLEPEGSAHHRLPSAASSRYQGSASRWVHSSPAWTGRTGWPASSR